MAERAHFSELHEYKSPLENTNIPDFYHIHKSMQKAQNPNPPSFNHQNSYTYNDSQLEKRDLKLEQQIFQLNQKTSSNLTSQNTLNFKGTSPFQDLAIQELEQEKLKNIELNRQISEIIQNYESLIQQTESESNRIDPRKHNFIKENLKQTEAELRENHLTIEHLRSLMQVKEEEISYLTQRLKKYLQMAEDFEALQLERDEHATQKLKDLKSKDSINFQENAQKLEKQVEKMRKDESEFRDMIAKLQKQVTMKDLDIEKVMFKTAEFDSLKEKFMKKKEKLKKIENLLKEEKKISLNFKDLLENQDGLSKKYEKSKKKLDQKKDKIKKLKSKIKELESEMEINQAPKVFRIEEAAKQQVIYQNDPKLVMANKELTLRIEESLKEEQKVKRELSMKSEELTSVQKKFEELLNSKNEMEVKYQVEALNKEQVMQQNIQVNRTVLKEDFSSEKIEKIFDKVEYYAQKRQKQMLFDSMFFQGQARKWKLIAQQNLKEKTRDIEGFERSVYQLWEEMRHNLMFFVDDVFQMSATQSAHQKRQFDFLFFLFNHFQKYFSQYQQNEETLL